MADVTDYLVKGCGASAMSFVDAMLRETNATFTIVDERAAPGGHWNDAYPFVRLHQPSACYGVGSRDLGHGRIDSAGFNRGLHELASGFEVADYFHQLMRDTFLPSGRVSYHPVSRVIGDENGPTGTFVSLLSGAERRVNVKKKRVDATLLNTSIPLTHTRNFSVAEGVACIPPNDLTRAAPKHTSFTVLGAGKTAIDSVLWLLANGAAPDAVSWVLPRDPWLLNRALLQPGDEFFEQCIGSIASQYEICATAKSTKELCERMQADGQWLRLDPDVWPTMFHAATVTIAEHEALRTLKNLVRKGRVQRIEPDKLVLDGGEVPASAGTLYVDCTARALGGNVNDRRPVFSPGLVRLQMIRQFQPTFSAALIGHLEAVIPDDAEKQKFCLVTPMVDTVEDWTAMMSASMINQGAWMNHPLVRDWIIKCRLDLYARPMRQVSPEDSAKIAILTRLTAAGPLAVQNLFQLARAAP